MAYSDVIEPISSSKKKVNDPYERYAHLLDVMNELVEETNEYLLNAKNLEIEEIILAVCSKDRELQFGRKVTHLNIRAILQQAQNDDSEQKSQIYRDPKSLYLDTASVMCHVAAVSFGPGFTAVGESFRTSSTYNDKVMRSSEERLSHSYQRMRDLVGDHSQQMQSADKGYDQIEAAINRIMQSYERMSQFILGN